VSTAVAIWLSLLAMTAPAPPEASGAAVAESVLPAEAWVGAKTAYEQADYAQAIEHYRGLLATGHDGGRLHYNLGNAYLRNGELGRAIAAYLRARSRLPRDGDVGANLEFARQSARDAIAPPAPTPLVATLFFWHFALSRAELSWLVAALNLLLWSTLALRLWRPTLAGSKGAVALFVALLLATGGSLAVRTLWPARTVVVVPQEIPAYTAPDAESTLRFKLHAGSELRLRGRRDGWLRIALPSGEQGWIESDWAEVVET
jgi:tetratricopeptide (TPR) repeat protein